MQMTCLFQSEIYYLYKNIKKISKSWRTHFFQITTPYVKK